jgi:hypothetical protein
MAIRQIILHTLLHTTSKSNTLPPGSHIFAARVTVCFCYNKAGDLGEMLKQGSTAKIKRDPHGQMNEIMRIVWI